MFIHIFKYQLKKGFRNKMNIGWTLLFPIVLGTLFYVSFSDIYESDRVDTVPTAIVTENLEETEREALEEIIESVELSEGKKLITPFYTDAEEALVLLDEGEVFGIITADSMEKLELTVKETGIQESILSIFISEYAQMTNLIRNVSTEHPEKLQEAIQTFSEEISYIAEEKMSGENKDPYVQYFYNLIAMVCLMGSMAGLTIPINSQANLSDVGARSNLSPITKPVSEITAFLAQFLVQLVIVCISLFYLIGILGINFGIGYHYILLTATVGTFFGMAIGFLIGHIGTASENTKNNILTVISVGGCFLSGLMVMNMKMVVQQNCPIVNKINPAALITDAFYSLNIYGVGERFHQNLVLLMIEAAMFLIIGMILARRTRYASI